MLQERDGDGMKKQGEDLEGQEKGKKMNLRNVDKVELTAGGD